MNRYRQYGRMDDEPTPVGDATFSRLDMRSDPAVLTDGAVQRSENMRFGLDGARPRAGIASRLGAATIASAIRWAGVYRPDASNDRLAFVLSDRLVLFNPEDQTVTEYAYPGSQTVSATDPVDFIQGGIDSGTTRTAYILRGLNKTVLAFDGSAVTEDTSFRKGLFGIFYQNRMAVAAGETSTTESQRIDVSDFLDFATWSSLAQFKVLWGGDDFLVGLLAYQKDIVIIGARKRFFVAYFAPQFGTGGYSGGLRETESFLRDLTREAGLVSRGAFLEAGGLIWALSDDGIYAFEPRLDLELTVLGDPLSGPIQPIIDRINANSAAGAVAEHFGERIYWALPVSDEPLTVIDILTNGSTATVQLPSDPNCAVGDSIEIRGTVTDGLNGIFTVTAVSENTVSFASSVAAGSLVGNRATFQRLATRNNAIAVFNLSRPYRDPITGKQYPGAWESVDFLPEGVFADWLEIADQGARRRLWLIDKDNGPFLYEEGDVDETGNLTDALRTGARLPAQLRSGNRTSVPIAGRLTSRVFRWGAFPRQVKAGEVRLAVSGGDAGTVTFRVRTPDRAAWESTRTFSGASGSDISARKRCGKRGLEAEIEIRTTSGRPAIRSMVIEVVNSGRVAEEG